MTDQDVGATMPDDKARKLLTAHHGEKEGDDAKK